MAKKAFWSQLLTISFLTFTGMSGVALAQETTASPSENTTQKICSGDAVDKLLPPLPVPSKESNSRLSYLADELFIPTQEGSWACYINDSKTEGRYYTLFKAQEVNGSLVASSFLDGGNLIAGQDSKSLDFFMSLIEHHTDINPEERQSVRRYLQAFISLVQAGTIQPSRRVFLFNQPNGALITYQQLTTGKLQGTAITLNVRSPKKVSATPNKRGISSTPIQTVKPSQQ